MPSVICPHCQASLNAKPERIGTAANCPKCGQSFVLGSGMPPPPLPEFDAGESDDKLDPKLIATTLAATAAGFGLIFLLFGQIGPAVLLMAGGGIGWMVVNRPQWIGMAARWSGKAAETATNAAASAVHSVADARARAKEARASASTDQANGSAIPRDGREQEIWTIRPSIFKTYPSGSIFWAGVFGIGGLLAVVPMNEPNLKIFAAGICGLALLAFARMWMACAAKSLTITTKRTRLRHGILSKRTAEVRHKDIRQVKVSQGFVDRIWNVGAIAISSSAGAGDEIVIGGISDVGQVADLIRELQD